jgi:hypothetical protein
MTATNVILTKTHLYREQLHARMLGQSQTAFDAPIPVPV